ncbi:MAG TPA: protein translocase subunit SecF [Patescibacteria group bacterium]|nr:protein translocase subunit SecF [Patescibacteria group bacterium]
MINWMKYRWLYLLISGTVIIFGIFSLVKWGLEIGVEFKGGTLVEYNLEKDIGSISIVDNVKKSGVEVSSVQKTQSGSYLLKLGQVDPTKRANIQSNLEKTAGKVTELRFETIGPTVGSELVKKTLYGLLLAASGILIWVAIQFKSFKFGVSAVLAMLHDSLVVIGMYSIFGHFFGAEVDLLFVTALLTILSFSVHDTIIVYDRVRESKKGFSDDIYNLANKAVTETMVRSLNNSFVVIFMMIALLLLGGTTIRWFVATLLVGTISGAYSSPFVAVPILVTWDELQSKLKRKN